MSKPKSYEFGPFCLDVTARRLLRDGAEVTLQRKAFETLALLVENCGRVVEKEEFLGTVWRDSFVEDGSLTVNISILRKTLGDDRNGHGFIETVPRRGYRFVAPVRTVYAEPDGDGSTAQPALTSSAADESRPQSNEATPPVGRLRVERRRIFLAAAPVAALAALLLGYWLRPAPPRTIAVLPFANLKPDAETNFLGFSLADAVAARLADLRAPQLAMISTVYRPTSQTPDPQQAAGQLQADLLLHGSYLKEDDRLQVTAALTETPSRHVVWQEMFEFKYDKVMTVHEEVARRVIAAFNVRLTDTQAKLLAADASRDPLAYEYYLRGVDLYSQSRLDLAIELLEKSVALDPQFARAWDYLGSSYAVNASIRFGGQAQYEKARRAFEQAIRLNPAQPRPRVFLADLLIETNRAEEAVPLLREVLAAHPQSALAEWELSYACRYAGLLDKSLKFGEHALAADPSFKLTNAVFITYLYTGQYQKFLDSLAAANDTPYAAFYRGFAHYHLQDYDRARAEFDRAYEADSNLLQARIGKALSYGLTKRPLEGLRLLAQAEREVAERGVGDAEGVYKVAQAYAALGDRAAALRVMRRAVEGGFFAYPYLANDPLTAGLRGEKEYAELMEAARRRHEAFKQSFF